MTSTAETTQQHEDHAAAALRTAERNGFRLMLIGRSIVLVPVLMWTGYGAWVTGNMVGPTVTAGALATGLAFLYAMRSGHDQAWHRYALVALDLSLLAAIGMFVPLKQGAEVPQIFVFRTYGTGLIWVLLAVSALALSPRLILFAGLYGAAAVWAVFAKAVFEMERTVSWDDLAPDSSGAEYVSLVLDPDFIATGNRVVETSALVAGAVILAVVIERARRVVAAFAEESATRQRVERLFGRHVPEAVARRLMAVRGALAPSVQPGSALFMDLAGFTGFAARHPPDHVLSAIDRVLSLATAAIVREGGVVVSFGGDSILATFGVLSPAAGHAESAVRAAEAILAALQSDSGEGPGLAARIGIATGPIAAGIIGDSARQSYTVYGATVNLAQRLEAANKESGTALLFCAETAQACTDRSSFRPVRALALPGFADPVAAFTLERSGGSPQIA
jgi:class 3 adenylate cyclase